MLIYFYFNKEIYVNWCFVDVMKIHPTQVLTKGLILFNLSHPAHNICSEIFVDILTCFKCYQLEDHPTS